MAKIGRERSGNQTVEADLDTDDFRQSENPAVANSEEHAETLDADAPDKVESSDARQHDALSTAIRKRAYQIWEEDGRPDGMQDDHWSRAERELREGGSDLEDNPGIGVSLGTTGAEADSLGLGESTYEGDVMNDTTEAGGIDPSQRGRTNK